MKSNLFIAVALSLSGLFLLDCMGIAIKYLSECKVDAVVSAGNTGALMAMSKLQLRMLEGIIRPAIAATFPIVICSFITSRTFGNSLFDKQLISRGVAITKGREQIRLNEALIKNYVDSQYTKLKLSTSIDFLFPIENSKIEKIFGSNSKNQSYFASWTTTPWTLPGNLALTVNESFVYELIEIIFNNRKINLILAKELAQSTLERIGLDTYNSLGTCKGSDMLGIKASHPYLDRDSLIIAGDHVTTEAGTGIVHTAPGHGLEDYLVSIENGLEVLNTVKANGTFKDDVAHFAGQFIFNANDNIIDLLKEKDVLLSQSQYEHSYPHCWRHKTPAVSYTHLTLPTSDLV